MPAFDTEDTKTSGCNNKPYQAYSFIFQRNPPGKKLILNELLPFIEGLEQHSSFLMTNN